MEATYQAVAAVLESKSGTYRYRNGFRRLIMAVLILASIATLRFVFDLKSADERSVLSYAWNLLELALAAGCLWSCWITYRGFETLEVSSQGIAFQPYGLAFAKSDIEAVEVDEKRMTLRLNEPRILLLAPAWSLGNRVGLMFNDRVLERMPTPGN